MSNKNIEVALNQGPRRDDGVGSNPELSGQHRHLTTDDQIPRTDEELAGKLRGQLEGAVETLQQLAGREYHISVNLGADDCEQWFYRLVISKTRYL